MRASRTHRRKAAGHLLTYAFGVLMHLNGYILRFNHLEWGDDLFTDKELQYLETIKMRNHTNSEMCRKLAHRLRRADK